MVHDKRLYSIKQVESAAELADKLINHTWCNCCGFQVKETNYLFLNDAFGEDSVQEYAVLKINPGGSMFQVESITFGWIEEIDRALEYINCCLSGQSDDVCNRKPVSVKTEDCHGHRCYNCA